MKAFPQVIAEAAAASIESGCIVTIEASTDAQYDRLTNWLKRNYDRCERGVAHWRGFFPASGDVWMVDVALPTD